MIFSELYSAYYNAVADVLRAAVDHPLDKGELRRIVARNAFGKSFLNIEPALSEGRWQLMKADGTTVLHHAPTMPLTLLQRRWLKAISLDPRIRLFTDEPYSPDDVEPLFRREDICVFDRYSDGDPFEDEEYVKNFRLILDAVRHRYPLSIDTGTRKGNSAHIVIMPEYLEYSEKDDKFRLIGSGCRYGNIVNLARIRKCEPFSGPDKIIQEKRKSEQRCAEFELVDRRNALERVLLHFAHFEKQAEKSDGNRYRITVAYDKNDETEIVIRILSFGPMIRVTAPDEFVGLIKERLKQQKSCGLQISRANYGSRNSEQHVQ